MSNSTRRYAHFLNQNQSWPKAVLTLVDRLFYHHIRQMRIKKMRCYLSRVYGIFGAHISHSWFGSKTLIAERDNLREEHALIMQEIDNSHTKSQLLKQNELLTVSELKDLSNRLEVYFCFRLWKLTLYSTNVTFYKKSSLLSKFRQSLRLIPKSLLVSRLQILGKILISMTYSQN